MQKLAIAAEYGFALAAVLLLGYRVWPGIAIGAFFANIWAFLDTTNANSVAIPIAISSSIAAGTTLSAILGNYLLQKYVGRRHLFDSRQNVLKFVFWGGMCSPFVSKAFGVIALCWSGIIPWAAFGNKCLIWWMSMLGGILIFTPFLLIWIPPIFAAISRYLKIVFSSQKKVKLPLDIDFDCIDNSSCGNSKRFRAFCRSGFE